MFCTALPQQRNAYTEEHVFVRRKPAVRRELSPSMHTLSGTHGLAQGIVVSSHTRDDRIMSVRHTKLQQNIMNELNITSEFGLTEEQLEYMIAKYENGTWTGEVTEPRRGRPYEFDEDQLNASSQLPETNSD